MITETTLRTLVNKKQYDTAFIELSRKGQVTFDTRYTMVVIRFELLEEPIVISIHGPPP